MAIVDALIPNLHADSGFDRAALNELVRAFMGLTSTAGGGVQFETLLLQIAEYAEEWLTSAQALGLARRVTTDRVVPWDRPSTRLATARPPLADAVRGR